MPSDVFQLDTQSIIQLLGDPKFYGKNLAFLHLEGSATVAVAKYHQAALNKEDRNCKGCGSGKTDGMSYVTGSISHFVRILRKLKEIDSNLGLEQLKSFIGARLGYAPRLVRLYYATGTDEEKTALEF